MTLHTRTTSRLLRVVATTLGLAMMTLASGCGGGGESTPAGTWQESSAERAPSLELKDDGSFNGTDGCNQLFGSWSETGEKIGFEQVGMTQMACDGVDEWLAQLASATIDGSTMTVLDQSGATIGTLTKDG